MKYMKKLVNAIVIVLLFIQCTSDKNNIVAKNSIGTINKNTSIEELDNLFKNDSVVKIPNDSDFIREYKVFNIGGKHLLTIKPEYRNDSLKSISSVKIYSDTYKTEKEVSTASTYKDVLDNYSVSKVEPSFSSAIVFIDEINATIAIDKKDLRIDEFDMQKISKDQIPDMAKIQYITLWFD